MPRCSTVSAGRAAGAPAILCVLTVVLAVVAWDSRGETSFAAEHDGGRSDPKASEERGESPTRSAVPASPSAVRCAVIGGMMDTGFWPKTLERFTQATNHEAVVVAAGPKRVIAKTFAAGEADLITMHASDTIINLVADGLGENPQPWARNDLLLVGPPEDPAKVHGMDDAAPAFRRIVEGQYRVLMHRSQGAQEVMLNIIADSRARLDPSQVLALPVDDERAMMTFARKKSAYTLVGRIPFRNGKIDDGGMKVMVEGDPRLRRPYVVVTAVPSSANRERLEAARALAAFLRSRATQAWIAEFGRGELDERPIFFPVTVPKGE